MKSFFGFGTTRTAARVTICGKVAQFIRSGVVLLAMLLAVLSCAQGQPVLFNVVHEFGYTNQPDGSTARTRLLLASDNALYGVTEGGGSNGVGILYEVNPDGSDYRILHNFVGATGDYAEGSLIEGLDHQLYGTTSEVTSNAGTIFRVQLDGQNYTILHEFTNSPDGALPYGQMIQANNGVLYGTTSKGGLGYGTIYSMNPDGSGYQILHEFSKIPDGGQPEAGLVLTGGMLYGLTSVGGVDTNSFGTMFRISPTGTGYQILHNFTGGSDGAGPAGSLIVGSDGALYGATSGGGTDNDGTLFKIDPDGSNYMILHSFTNAPDGNYPQAGLVRGFDGGLYGTTSFGGAGPYRGGGTVFRVSEDGSSYEVLYMFTNTTDDGASPLSALIQGPYSPGSAGLLYGTTSTSGLGGSGTIFGLLINPPVSITPVSAGPVLFWPGWALNYTLQSTTNLSTGPWVTLTNAGTPVTGLELTNTVAPNAYFRLVWQP